MNLASQQTSSIPILNEPGMQPLIPLISDIESKPAQNTVNSNTTDNEEKNGITATTTTTTTSSNDVLDNSEEKVSEIRIVKPTPSPPTMPISVTNTTPLATVELNEDHLKSCSELFFFIRDHPEIIVDIIKCCDNLQVIFYISHISFFISNLGINGINTSLCNKNLCTLVN